MDEGVWAMNLAAWLDRQTAQDLTLSWQTLAAMVSISSVIVSIAVVYLRLFVGGELLKTKLEMKDHVRRVMREELQDRRARAENLKDSEDHENQ
jgi:hypothetical protein